VNQASGVRLQALGRSPDWKQTVSGTCRDLKCWQKALDLSVLTYRATAKFPREEIFGLASQLRRASVSVISNIAEGKGRSSEKELLRFLANARVRSLKWRPK
jgi:hypothetical protein